MCRGICKTLGLRDWTGREGGNAEVSVASGELDVETLRGLIGQVVHYVVLATRSRSLSTCPEVACSSAGRRESRRAH